MRILAFARRFPPDVDTGRAMAFARIVARLREQHDVRLVAGYHRDRAEIPQDALGVDLRRRSPIPAHVALWRAARSATQRFDPDVVVVGSVDVPLMTRPTIAVVRDLAGTGWGDDAPPRDLWHRWRVRQFAGVVVPGHHAEREVKRFGVDARRVSVIPDPIEVVSAPRGPRRPGPLRVVHAGRFLPAKAQHLSIDAVSRLPAAMKERLELQVVGHVGDRVYYDQLRVAARGQPVRFHPDVPELGPFLRDADLVLYPTALRAEWPDVALEAMAHGAPVAWTDLPAVREAVGGLGIALPPEDFGALRAAVARVFDEGEALARAGDAGRLFVASNYGWERVGAAWEALLQRIARKPRGRSE